MSIDQLVALRLDAPKLGGLPSVLLRPQAGASARPAVPAMRPRRESASPAIEVVTSHVETLIERVTGVEKAIPDPDGDYALRFRDALYFVRITSRDVQPVVRVFSQVVSNLEPSPELFEAINHVNTKLDFCRCFLLDDRVFIETEHLGMTIRTDDFRELTQNVAEASAFFGSMLTEQFGGRLPFGDMQCDDNAADLAAPAPSIGMYL